MKKLGKGMLWVAQKAASVVVEQEKRGQSYCHFFLHQPKRPVVRKEK